MGKAKAHRKNGGQTMNFLSRLSLAFSAGALGGLVNGLAVWLFGAVGFTAALGVNIAPQLTKAFLYPRIVWGGIWGVVLLFPLIRSSHVLRGLVLSILPTLVTLLIIFPSKGKGMLGVELGTLTPLFSLIFNAIWGIVAGGWYTVTSGRLRHRRKV